MTGIIQSGDIGRRTTKGQGAEAQAQGDQGKKGYAARINTHDF
jgi:hypothetical protein